MSEIEKYYSEYHENFKEDAYTMTRASHHSRMLALQEYIKNVTPLGGKVADIGCNDLYMAKVFPEFKWTGIELAPPPGSPKEIIQHNLEITPYPLKSGDYDTVICTEVLEHLFSPLIVHREANRVLKKGGHYIISTPNFDHVDWLLTHYRDVLFNHDLKHSVEHIRWYNLERHAAMLNQSGFRVIDRVGADAHYTAFFSDARIELKKVMPDKLDIEIDQLIGKCFRDYSHTICVLAQKEV